MTLYRQRWRWAGQSPCWWCLCAGRLKSSWSRPVCTWVHQNSASQFLS